MIADNIIKIFNNSKLNNIKNSISNELVDEIEKEDINEDLKGKVLLHVQTFMLSEETLTRNEFEIFFFKQYGIDSNIKLRLWKHNKECLILFKNFYFQLLHIIKCLKRDMDEILQQQCIEYLRKLILNLSKFRKWHFFCNECKYNSSNGICKFWNKIISDLKKIKKSLKIRKYFLAIEIECLCSGLLSIK